MSDAPLPDFPNAPVRVSSSKLRGNRVKTVFSKEFREVFRDRRTVLSVIISPLVITPILFMIVGVIVGTETNKERQRVYDVGVVGGKSAPALERAIDSIGSLRAREIDEAEAESEVSSKRLSAVVIFPQDTRRACC